MTTHNTNPGGQPLDAGFTHDIEPCPDCGALPCDWVNSPLWQPIETAPKDGTEVLVLIRAKVIRLGWYFVRSSRTAGWCDENGKAITPTHWMSLPAPPVRAA
jgi:hypothetical protein